jgi:23S rRNA pseudouridine2604 synthase
MSAFPALRTHCPCPSLSACPNASSNSSAARAEAELFIEGGWVTVDGEVVDSRSSRSATSAWNSAWRPRRNPEPVTLLLNQPAGQNVTIAQAGMSMATSAKPTAKQAPAARPLHPPDCIAPLLPGASGLQVFTQDWRVSRKVDRRPAAAEQEYIVEVSGEANLVRWNAWPAA